MKHHEIVTAASYVFGASLRRELGVTATAPSIDAVLRLACHLELTVGAHLAKPRDPERAATGALNELIRKHLTAAKVYPTDPAEQRSMREAVAAGFYGQVFRMNGWRLDPDGAEKLEREMDALE